MTNSGKALLERLLEAMARTEFYSSRPEQVERRETHISWVFIAGDSVFKIKKPIKFDFVDYSTLERRFAMCCEEVRLNRRLAAGIYLGVVPIMMRGDGFAIAPACDSPVVDAVEYAVWMRRLSEDNSLESLLRRGEVNAAKLGQIAEVIAGFHRQAAREQAVRYGGAAAIERGIMGNLAECAGFVNQTVSPAEFDELTQRNRQFLERHHDTFDLRARTGRVCEGHGDLRCEHLYLAPGEQPAIIDCVEFNEALRYADVASDLAFLLMDMERLGAAGQAHALFEAYLHASGDGQLAELLNFYKCYRATVRGKVASLKSRQPGIADPESERAKKVAAKHFQAAVGYARLCGPALIVVYGLSGSGKSTVAKLLANRLGCAHYNSDVFRKQLFAAPRATRAVGYREGIYTPQQTRKTYDALLSAARQELEAGRSAVLDASFLDEGARVRVVELARTARVPFVMAECTASESEIGRRLAIRAQQPDAISDATFETYLRQKEELAPLGPELSSHHVLVNTERSPIDSVLVIEEAIAKGSNRLRPA
ncbi:MAG TPA: AAA family ATPase [Candidatus Binataceae bacterium]|nr:AAA family ATPase [Candidatus Binataceae bacterium]